MCQNIFNCSGVFIALVVNTRVITDVERHVKTYTFKANTHAHIQ